MEQIITSEESIMEIGAEVTLPLELEVDEDPNSSFFIGHLEPSVSVSDMYDEKVPTKLNVPEDALITQTDLNSKIIFYLDFSSGMSVGCWYSHFIICGDEKFYLLRKRLGSKVYWGLFLVMQIAVSPTYNAKLEFQLPTGQTIMMYQDKIGSIDLKRLESPDTGSIELEKFLSFASTADEIQASVRIGMNLDEMMPGSDDWEVNDELDDEFFLSSEESEIEDDSSSGYDTSGDDDSGEAEEMVLQISN